MEIAWYIYPLIIASGIACGFINTLAGSGSLITLPLLIYLGLPANIANGTNRVAILLQSIVAVGGFRRQKMFGFRESLRFVIPASIGGLVGAQIAVGLDEEVLRRVLGALMIVMLFVILLRPKRFIEGTDTEGESHKWFIYPVMFAIGVYGGFIQAGVGIFLIAGLVLVAGIELVRANAIKVLIIFVFTIVALGVFVANDQVRWIPGLILGVGNMIGAQIAVKMSIKGGARFVRWVLIAVVAASAVLLLGLDRVLGIK